MKCMVIAYINSKIVLQDIENILDYKKFAITESNHCYRVFQGHVHGGIMNLVGSLNKELADTVFEIEDSLFIVYPSWYGTGDASLCTIIIKRKGNKQLRSSFLLK